MKGILIEDVKEGMVYKFTPPYHPTHWYYLKANKHRPPFVVFEVLNKDFTPQNRREEHNSIEIERYLTEIPQPITKVKTDRFQFRQYHECQNGHPRFLYWKMNDGFSNHSYWGELHPECNCPSFSFGEGFGSKSFPEISTTLHDQKDKTVFEGDIILDQYGRKLIVVWHNYRLKFQWIERPEDAHFRFSDIFEWVDIEGNITGEIVGNIHDKNNTSNT